MTYHKLYSSRRLFFSLAAFALLLWLSVRAFGSVSEQTLDEQKRSLETALHRNIVHCYAVNGYYPESLEDLLRYYPLVYDESLFLIHYQPIASNLMPDVTVIERKSES